MEHNNRVVAAAVVILLAVFVAQALYFAANSSYTYDETVSVINGYYYLTTHDLRLGLSQPPLGAYLSAIPLFLLDVHFDFSRESCRAYDNWLCAHEVLFESGNNALQILFFSRLMSIAASAAVGFLIFVWARELFGVRPALLSLALFAFNPIIISHGTLALTNSFLAFFVLLNFYFFHRLLRKYSFRNCALFFLSFALAVASKVNALILLPVIYTVLLLLLWRIKAVTLLPLLRKGWWANIKVFALHAFFGAVVTFFVLLMVYQFQFGTLASSVPPKYVPVFEDKIASQLPLSIAKVAEFVVFRLPLPFPSFFSGAAWHAVAGETKLSFLNGEIFTGTKLLFFQLVFILKTPLALIALALLGLFISLAGKFKLHNPAAKGGILFLIIPGVVWFAFFALTLNSGVQHILPIYPLVIILAGRSALWLSGLNIRTAFISLLLLWSVASAALIAPYYLAYFNELAGGADRGHAVLGVPNFDWGQDLHSLRRYMAGNNISSLKLSYFGTASPASYGINFQYLASPIFQPWDPNFTPIAPKGYVESCGPASGIVAVSATNYYGIFLNNRSCYDWLRNYQPVARVGHTIWVYNLSGGQLN